MKRLLMLGLAAAMVYVAPIATGTTNQAEAQGARCRSLARRVRSYKRIRSSYLRSWRRCTRRNGRYSRRCRSLRRAVNRWYSKVRVARSNYRAWGCRFGWDEWNDPWASRRRARYQAAKCRSLSNRVASYKRIRSSYLRSWRRCKWRRGAYSPRCRRLRRAVNRWYSKVRVARSNYSAWGCRFGWDEWSDPWAARRRSRARYQAAKCRSLSRRVASYKRIRSSYLRSWRRCKWRRGAYSPRCRRLRRSVNRWYSKVRAARSNYNAWGCRFGWGEWNDPWR